MSQAIIRYDLLAPCIHPICIPRSVWITTFLQVVNILLVKVNLQSRWWQATNCISDIKLHNPPSVWACILCPAFVLRSSGELICEHNGPACHHMGLSDILLHTCAPITPTGFKIKYWNIKHSYHLYQFCPALHNQHTQPAGFLLTCKSNLQHGKWNLGQQNEKGNRETDNFSAIPWCRDTEREIKTVPTL